MDNHKNLSNIINDYFDKTPYFDLYNLDIWITIVIIFIVLLIVIYYFSINTLKNQKIYFQQNKCNPFIMPFASTIQSETDSSFNATNFQDCLNKTNFNIASDAFSPLDGFFGSIIQFFNYLGQMVTNFTSFLMYLLGLLFKLYKIVIERFRIILSAINETFIGIGDFFNHILGLITNLYYTIILLVDSLKYVFTIIALAFTYTATFPAIIVASTSFVIMITALTIAVSMGWLFPPFAPFSMMWLFGIFGTTLITFLVSLSISIILSVLGNILSSFAIQMIEEGPRLSRPP